MGALGGILTLDGSPVAKGWLQELGSRLARRGPDQETLFAAGPIGLVHRGYGTRQLERDRASLWQARGGALLAFDGRLDNGPDLARALGMPGAEARRDSAIMLAGLERFGTLFIGMLVGDFALAYWDPQTRALTLGRDSAGVQALYFHRTPHAFVFATDLGGLVTTARIDRELDEDYIAAFLSDEIDETSTMYRQVKALAPAHTLTIGVDGKRSDSRVWALSPDPKEIRYGDDREYEEHFRALFEEAITVRLRSSHPVVAELSGGLDSSSIVCMADHALRHDATLAPSFSTLSFVLDRSPSSDEGPFRSAVEEHCGRETHHIVESDVPPFGSPDDAEHLHLLSGFFVSPGLEMAEIARMRSVGAHVMLSGIGGDEMFYPTHLPVPGLSDLLVKGRLPTLHRELGLWSAAVKEPYIKLLWRACVMGIGRRTLRKDHGLPPWLHPRFSPHVAEVRNRLVRTNERRLRRYRLPSRRDHAAGYYAAVRGIATGVRQELDARLVTYPCLHRPLAEFMHAVPFSQKLRRGQSRSLQRRALGPLMPERVLKRRGKGLVAECLIRRVQEGRPFWEQLLTGSVADRCGYIDAKATAAELRRFSTGIVAHIPMPAIALENWLRTHGAT